MLAAEPSHVDTGEFINPEVGYERAQRYVKALIAERDDKVTRLAEVLVQNARLLHKQLHPILEGGMEKCRMSSCIRVRNVLGQN